MKRTILAVLLAAPLLASAGPTNLLTNGSFEDSVVNGGSWGVYTSIPGWSVTTGIELRNNVSGSAKDGRNFAELDAYSNGAISQSFATIAGAFYELSFWYSNRTNTALDTNGLDYNVGAGWLSAPTLALNDSGDNQWVQYTYGFVAAGTQTTLSFRAAGISDSVGSSLDAISVTSAVPEPETYALVLAGLAAIGFVSRRRPKG